MIISKLKKSPMKICNTLHEIQKNFQETRSRKKLSQSKHLLKLTTYVTFNGKTVNACPLKIKD